MLYENSGIIISNLHRFCKSMELSPKISNLTMPQLKKKFKKDNQYVQNELSKISIENVIYASNKKDKKIHLTNVKNSFVNIYKEAKKNKISLEQSKNICNLIRASELVFDEDFLDDKVSFELLGVSDLHLLNQLFNFEDDESSIVKKKIEKTLNDKNIFIKDGPYYKEINNERGNSIFILFK